MIDLVQELTDRLEHHLNQLCDAKACETPEHVETRALIKRARERERVSFTPRTGPVF